MPNTLDPKPGWKTTEFYVAILVGIVPVLIPILQQTGQVPADVDPNQAAQDVSTAASTIGTSIAAIVAAVVGLGYIFGRSSVKKNATEAQVKAQQSNAING